MRLDKLTLDLRPRPHWQAIDLGFSLLRANAGTVYAAWLALWLPLWMLTSLPFVLWLGAEALVWCWLPAWWLRPLLERVVVHVLSRAVFGEQVTCWQALKAWPGELRRGWFRLLTWWRPFMAGRGLYQPIWQLERADRQLAAERRAVLGRDGAGSAAFWFGMVCFNFENILQLGLITFVSIFLSDGQLVNPFTAFMGEEQGGALLGNLLFASSYAFGVGVIAPIYSACCFTLYLNRRAELEAWDIEIVLRQLKAPAARPKGRRGLAAIALLLACGLLQPIPEVQAAENKFCEPPEWVLQARKERGAPQDALQADLRKRLDALYQSDELRGYTCRASWQSRKKEEKKKEEEPDLSWLPELKLPAWVPDLVKALLIAAGIAAASWLLWRYREPMAELLQGKRLPSPPKQIAGLDIRPESLPDDVIGEVQKLWQAGQARAAMALLYRATLSRLAHQHGLSLPRGATEGDCLIAARRAQQQDKLANSLLQTLIDTSQLWQATAYAGQQPAETQLQVLCQNWRQAFAQGRTR